MSPRQQTVSVQQRMYGFGIIAGCAVAVVTTLVAVFFIESAATDVPSMSADPQQGGRHPLRIPERFLNFGTVTLTPKMSWTMPVYNDSPDRILIRRFHTSCSCTEVVPTSIEIPPGEHRDVKVEIALAARTQRDASRHLRTVAIEVIPVVENASAPLSGWRISGNVKAPLIAIPPRLFVECDRLNCRNEAKLLVTCAGDLGVSDLKVLGLDGRADVSVRRLAGSPPRFEVTVAPNEGFPEGVFSLTTTFNAVDADRAEVASLEYEIEGKAVEDVIALPDSLVFRFDQENSVTKSLTLQSRSGRNITKVNVLLPMPQDLNLSFSMNDSPSVQVTATKRAIRREKAANDSLGIVVATEGQKERVLRVPVLSYSPTSMSDDADRGAFDLGNTQ